MSASIHAVAEEFARRAVQFNPDTDPMKIDLWGLFHWGDVSKYIKDGRIKTSYTKENRIIWCKPSQTFYDKHIKHIIERMKKEQVK